MLEVGEQRRLQHDADDDHQAEADAADHGTGTGGYFSTFTKVSASRSTTGRSSASRAIAPPAPTSRTTRADDEVPREATRRRRRASPRRRPSSTAIGRRAVVDHREAQQVAVALTRRRCPSARIPSPCTSCAPTPKLRSSMRCTIARVLRHATRPCRRAPTCRCCTDDHGMSIAMPDDAALRDARTCA